MRELGTYFIKMKDFEKAAELLNASLDILRRTTPNDLIEISGSMIFCGICNISFALVFVKLEACI